MTELFQFFSSTISDNACEHNVDIGGTNEILVDAGVKSTGKECQVACQGNTNCDFFVWGGPEAWRPNGCWLKQFKGQRFIEITQSTLNGAFAGLTDCLEKGNSTRFCLKIYLLYAI